MSVRDKSIWILIVFIFSGLVIGGLLGDIASKTPGFSWLAYGQSFGFTEPLKLDLNILYFVKLNYLIFKINNIIIIENIR